MNTGKAIRTLMILAATGLFATGCVTAKQASQAASASAPPPWVQASFAARIVIGASFEIFSHLLRAPQLHRSELRLTGDSG